jgi:predicted tellurium resistance membrane protein TerC
MIESLLQLISDPNAWIAFLTLSALEIILGIDNIIFISVIANRLPIEIREKVRRFGLIFALVTRILLLLSLSWVMSLTNPLFTITNHAISGRDLILLLGGFFLIWKASKEIYTEVEEGEHNDETGSSDHQRAAKSMTALFIGSVLQIGLLDIIFSLDSVITAVGMVDDISVMIAAVLASVLIMLIAAKPIGDFVHHHPSIKVLALSFLTVVGVVLIAEGMGVHIPKGYVYVAMGFSLSVELLNIRSREKKKKPESNLLSH